MKTINNNLEPIYHITNEIYTFIDKNLDKNLVNELKTTLDEPLHEDIEKYKEDSGIDLLFNKNIIKNEKIK